MSAALQLVQGAPKPRSAAECLARLESSPLYRRREVEAAMTREAVRLAAVWFLSEGFRARWED